MVKFHCNLVVAGQITIVLRTGVEFVLISVIRLRKIGRFWLGGKMILPT